jgi:hypothetical protein
MPRTNVGEEEAIDDDGCILLHLDASEANARMSLWWHGPLCSALRTPDLEFLFHRPSGCSAGVQKGKEWQMAVPIPLGPFKTDDRTPNSPRKHAVNAALLPALSDGAAELKHCFPSTKNDIREASLKHSHPGCRTEPGPPAVD